VKPEILEQAEAYANQIVFENREVRSYFITDEDITTVPFRKPPKVSGRIRVVEVDGLDYTPCGGTHCPSSAMVGILKIVKTERVNQRARVHFVAGFQALEFFGGYQAVANRSATLLETGWEDVPAALERKLEQLKAALDELDVLRKRSLDAEAERLAGAAEDLGKVRLVVALRPGSSASELRMLAQLVRERPGFVAVLAGYSGGKLSLVTASASNTGVDARELLQNLLQPLGLRGGGETSLAQGGGLMEADKLDGLVENARDYFTGAGTAFS
jgi:alanyl-tRNA synthetase